MAAQASPLAPWLALLPEKLSTPLHYSAAQLAHLRGPTLHAATRSCFPASHLADLHAPLVLQVAACAHAHEHPHESRTWGMLHACVACLCTCMQRLLMCVC